MNYTLEVPHHFKGITQDLLEYHNNIGFSTKVRDNDLSTRDCCNIFGGFGWWFTKCFHVLLTRMKYDDNNRRWKPAPRWNTLYNTYI